MKKQLLAAAVAATMASVASADISITGNAKFEYFNTDNNGTKTNTTNTEVNLGIKGKSGDTSVVANLEFNTHGDVNNGSVANVLDVEDLYMTTKVGDVTVKAGNYASGTSALLGEIDEGGRVTNKVTLSTTLAGAKVYVGNDGSTGTGATAINNNMFAGVSMDVAGWTVQAKKNSPTVNSYGIKGSVAGVGVRLETKDNDTANSDVTFGHLTYSNSGVDFGYAFLDVDNTDSLVGETDSAIFAKENGGIASARDNKQISVKTNIDGNTVTIKSGSIEKGISSTKDKDYFQVAASRKLASGATFAATYTDEDMSSGDKQTMELDLSVKF